MNPSDGQMDCLPFGFSFSKRHPSAGLFCAVRGPRPSPLKMQNPCKKLFQGSSTSVMGGYCFDLLFASLLMFLTFSS